MQKRIYLFTLIVLMSNESIMAQEEDTEQELWAPGTADNTTGNLQNALPAPTIEREPGQGQAIMVPATDIQPESMQNAAIENSSSQEREIKADKQDKEQKEMEEIMPVVPQNQMVAETFDQEEITGIDTVNIHEPKGNWLYKRIWWEKAERLYEKIKQLSNKILELRMIFFARRHELDHSVVDPFYLNLGVEPDQLNEILTNLIAQTDENKSEEQELNEPEEQRRRTIASEKKSLEQLEQDTQKIAQYNLALDEALLKLIELLNQVHSYEQQAWESFKAINRELNDKKARELYYTMDSYWKNLNNINNYLSDAFSKYFDQLSNKIQQDIQTVKATIQSLKEKGIDLQLQAQILRGYQLPAVTSEETEEVEETGFFGTIWSWAKAPFVLIGNTSSVFFNWVIGLFGGSTVEERESSLEEETA